MARIQKRIPGRHSDKQPDDKPLTPTELATRALLRRAEEARSDIVKFYDFVIRHETTKQPLKAAPHQKVMFRFVIDNPLCVIRQPIGTGKTYGIGTLGLFLAGQDVTHRGAVVSKAQGQSAKVVNMISDYVTDPDLSAPLNLTFPWLKKTNRVREQWTQTAITFERPAAIRDPSVVAIGLEGQIQGSRLSWVVGDDLLDADNTSTETAREQCHQRFDARVLSRLDPTGSRAVITNTPWDKHDLTYTLEEMGWPSLSMNIYGDIWFSSNVPLDWILGTKLLKPSKIKENSWRLIEHGEDPNEEIPLWPERYSVETIKAIKDKRLPQDFARMFLCVPFDQKSNRCSKLWINAAKAEGAGKLHKIYEIEPNARVFTGVDIAIGATRKHDKSVIFTYQELENDKKQIIEIESGRWSGPDIADRVISKYDRFGSMIAVESNSAQEFINQFIQELRPDIRVFSHKTGMNRYNVEYGVESVFSDFQLGTWIIPCATFNNELKSTDEIEEWLEECLFYQPPPAHTGDRLMASWIAKELGRKRKKRKDPKPTAGSRLTNWKGGAY